MDEEKLRLLAEKFMQGNATEEEKLNLHDWYDTLTGDIEQEEIVVTENDEDANAVRKRLLATIQFSIQQSTPAKLVPINDRTKRWKYMAAAVVLIFVIGSGTYLLFNIQSAPGTKVVADKAPADILPGSSKAILTLADSSTLILDGAAEQKVIRQGDIVVKNGKGIIGYGNADHIEKEMAYNKLTTPRGGQYLLNLSDGTKVWLNAASSIKYPVAFTGKERRVELTGEAFFEVVHNNQKPFIVSINNKASVEVLGTSFNVMSYDDEPDVRTTLLNGAVRLTKDEEHVLLMPGQQAIVKPDESIRVTTVNDMEEVTAWKNGIFHFNQLSVAAMMRQLARWYNIEVKYTDEATRRKLSGDIGMNVPLSKVLEMLDYAGVHTTIEGNRLMLKQGH